MAQVELVGLEGAVAALQGIVDELSQPPDGLAEDAAGVVSDYAPVLTGYLASTALPVASSSEALVEVGAYYAPYTTWTGWLDDAMGEVEDLAQEAYDQAAEDACRAAG